MSFCRTRTSNSSPPVVRSRFLASRAWMMKVVSSFVATPSKRPGPHIMLHLACVMGKNENACQLSVNESPPSATRTTTSALPNRLLTSGVTHVSFVCETNLPLTST